MLSSSNSLRLAALAWLVACAIGITSAVHAEPLDLAQSVRNAVDKGADASQIIDMLTGYGVELSDAVVIAIHNAPDDMSGELALAAMDRATDTEKRDIGYLALSASRGEGTCVVADAIGVPQPSSCEVTRYTAKDYRSYNPVPIGEVIGGGSGPENPLASPGLL